MATERAVDVAVVMPPAGKRRATSPGPSPDRVRLGRGSDPPPGPGEDMAETDARGEILGRRLASALGLPEAEGGAVYRAVKGLVDYCREQAEEGEIEGMDEEESPPSGPSIGAGY